MMVSTLMCDWAPPQAMPEWTAENPLRVVTGYHAIARRYFAKVGLQHVKLLSADGALEAHPAMGSADIILDLVRALRLWGMTWNTCRASITQRCSPLGVPPSFIVGVCAPPSLQLRHHP